MHLLKTNPKAQFIFFLLLFFIVTSFRIPLTQSFYILTLCVSFSALAELVFTYTRKKTLFIPYSAIIMGLILSLIINPYTQWFQVLVSCVAAIGTKHLVRVKQRHIFNPAATGLLVTWVIYQTHPSWWSATLYPPTTLTIPNLVIFLSLLALAFVSCYKYKRFNTFLSFILSFTILSLLLSPSISITPLISRLLNPVILFYAIVMLPEPMTSPVNKKRQILYGCVVAFIYTLIVFIMKKSGQNFPDPSIVALLIGNLLFFRYR